MSAGIAVAYSGVHQAYQLALAAYELEALDCFYCSVIDEAGKWGRRLSRLFGPDAVMNRRINGLPADKVNENPWPLMWQRLRQSVFPSMANDWFGVNDVFDRRVAKRLTADSSRIFVGVETCALHSLEAAKRRGMTTVLDCPGIDSASLDQLAQQSAEEFGLQTSTPADAPAMRSRKKAELLLADIVLVSSAFQETTLRHASVFSARVATIALWVDTSFWQPSCETHMRRATDPFRVLFVGKIGLRKGVPYLLKAARSLGSSQFKFTLVGSREPQLNSFLTTCNGHIKVVAPVSKVLLRDLYRQHDVLVLPTLGDAFGFVVMEAMACGLPVIVSNNCGAPVPDPSWRIPVMNSEAICRRLEYYATNREAVRCDGAIALQFARRFTPERYREQIRVLFARLLEPVWI